MDSWDWGRNSHSGSANECLVIFCSGLLHLVLSDVLMHSDEHILLCLLGHICFLDELGETNSKSDCKVS
jgi:hypothetical protein